MASVSTAHFAGLAVDYRAEIDEPGTAAVWFVAPVCVDEDMLTAALYRDMVCDDPEELTDPEAVREIVANELVNAGLAELTDTLRASTAFRAGDESDQLWQRCRAAVRAAILTPADPGSPAPRALTGLAGVAS